MNEVKCVYKENGYKDRKDYLECLADEYGEQVWIFADLYGKDEDFDGLIAAIQY